MFGALVSIKRVSYCFGWLIRDDFEPLHKWLRPGAIRASPICGPSCGQQDLSRRFRHIPNSTLIHEVAENVPQLSSFGFS